MKMATKKEYKQLEEKLRDVITKQKVKEVIEKIDSKSKAGFINSHLLMEKLGIDEE